MKYFFVVTIESYDGVRLTGSGYVTSDDPEDRYSEALALMAEAYPNDGDPVCLFYHTEAVPKDKPEARVPLKVVRSGG